MKKIILSLVIIIMLGMFFFPIISKRRELTANRNKLQEQLKLEQKKNKELLEEKDRLKNDPFYLEQIAREKLGVTRDKEMTYKVITESQTEQNKRGGDKNEYRR